MMKFRLKRWVALLGLGVLLPGISVAQFVIKGERTGQAGEVYLITEKDTLAQTKLERGSFILRGKVDSPVIGHLVIGGKRYAAPLFLEEAEYRVEIDKDGKTLRVKEGGGLQKIRQELMDSLATNRKKKEDCLAGMQKARQEKNYMEEMHLRWELEQLDSMRVDAETRFMARYPNSLVTLDYIFSGLKRMKYPELNAKYAVLGEEAKQTELGKRITERYLKLKQVTVGSIAPDFQLNTPEGKTLSLYEVKSKVKILDFWASWCGPCRAENPTLVQLYGKYKDSGLEIISVSLDSKEAPWKKAIEDDHLSWIHVSSLTGWTCPVAQLYQVTSVPSIFILDADNRIVATKMRGERLVRKVEEMLK